MRQFVILALVLVLTVAYVQSVCVHNGVKYKVGESYKDKCNSCQCGKGGLGKCTKIGCHPRTADCTENGKKYWAGEQFMDADNCNTCTCTSTGAAGCTQKFCV